MTGDNVLLVLHPAVASDPQRLQQVKAKYEAEGASTTHQMLDRLAVDDHQVKSRLPDNHFAVIDIVAPAHEQEVAIPTSLFPYLFQTLVPGGKISGQIAAKQQTMDAIMAGFTPESNGTWVRPVESTTYSAAPLKLKPKPLNNGTKKTTIGKFNRGVTATVNKKLDTHDLFDSDDDEELIDENDLVEEQDSLSKPIILPQKCVVEPGKRRRKACKDCTCGLKELEAQEQDRQNKVQSQVVTSDLVEQLQTQDLQEVDFTVPGKTGGSCGSCALGDAFRCDGCPYLGLPPFKPGQVVSLAGLAQDDL